MKRLAVIGDPVSHSRSPAMQNAALEALGLADEWRYEAIQVPAEEFEQRVREMADGDFVGANVTIPHKERALALADDASEAARAIGAVNTLSFEAGRIVAENTDAAGVLAVAPADLAGGRALVLGAGGVARARQMRLLGLEAVDGPGVHALFPVGVVPVCDEERDRTAQGGAVAHAGAHLHRVALDLHPAPATVSQLAARHVAIHGSAIQGQPCGQTLDDRHEAGAM